MTGKGRTTLATRVAAVQTRVTVIALALVTLCTAVAVSFALSRKTDRQLDAVLGRVIPYLAERPTPPTDWKWLNAEISWRRSTCCRAYHLTLVQRSKMNFTAVIAKALAKQPGQVHSVEPAIHERSPIFHVGVATAGGGHVNLDVESGA